MVRSGHREVAENGTVTFRAPGPPGGMDPGAPMSWMKDDFDKNGIIGLSDAVLCMRILAKPKMTTTVGKEADVNGDGVIGLPDMIYVLQEIAGFGSPLQRILPVKQVDRSLFS